MQTLEQLERDNPTLAAFYRRVKERHVRAARQGRRYEAVLAADVRAGAKRNLREVVRPRRRALAALQRRDHPVQPHVPERRKQAIVHVPRRREPVAARSRPRERRTASRRGPPRPADDPDPLASAAPDGRELRVIPLGEFRAAVRSWREAVGS